MGAGTLAVTSPLDPHCDHAAAAAIAARVRARLPGLRLLHYPVWSRSPEGHAPAPRGTRALSFDAAPWRARKAAAIAAHPSQFGGVIDDDPGGFAFDPAFARALIEAPELYFEAA